MKKIHITTLGCSKNLVDSEVLSGRLELNQFEVIDSAQQADVIILNTCGFIEEAKEESIGAILEAVNLKKEDPAKKVFVAGCLSQRYEEAIKNDIPEVDAIFGTESYKEILEALGKKHAAMDNLYRMRKISTPRHYAYLKISEGCNHTCGFCAIPGIRGKQRSRSLDSLMDEAQRLVENGAKEIILISQDTSSYGRDLNGGQGIVSLLESLDEIEGLKWIRVLYWYPTNFPLDVLPLMKRSSKLLPYIDMPIQHISEHMLREMRRGDTRESLLHLFNTMRKEIPDIALRTTLISGHPGENDADFEELLQFIKDIRFDRLGVFTYSDEEDTASYNLSGKVDKEIARSRRDLIMETQRSISLDKNEELVGQTLEVLIDEFDKTSDSFIGRSFRDAPEVDNEVIINNLPGTKQIQIGLFYKVKIVTVSEYELYGELV